MRVACMCVCTNGINNGRFSLEPVSSFVRSRAAAADDCPFRTHILSSLFIYFTNNAALFGKERRIIRVQMFRERSRDLYSN